MRELLERDKARIVDGVPESDLVAYYPGLQGHGATLIDRSQYANHGTITNPKWKRLPSGLWVQNYDGTGYTIAPYNSAFNFAAGFTLEAWAKPSVVNVNSRLFYRYDSSSESGYYLGQSTTGAGKWEFTIFVGGSYVQIVSDAPSTTSWQHLIARRSAAGVVNIYVDLVLQADTGTLSGAINSSSSLYMGIDVSLSWIFTGLFGIPRMLSRTLSATEWTRHYNRERHLFGV